MCSVRSGHPGPVQIPRQNHLSLLQAISEAGGFARSADRRRIALKRSDAGESSPSRIIDVGALTKAGRGREWILKDGDIIIVPLKGRKESFGP